MGTIFLIGDITSPVGENIPNRGFLSQEEHSQRTNPQWEEILTIGDFKYSRGDIVPNWVFISVSLLISDEGVCRTAPATPGL